MAEDVPQDWAVTTAASRTVSFAAAGQLATGVDFGNTPTNVLQLGPDLDVSEGDWVYLIASVRDPDGTDGGQFDHAWWVLDGDENEVVVGAGLEVGLRVPDDGNYRLLFAATDLDDPAGTVYRDEIGISAANVPPEPRVSGPASIGEYETDVLALGEIARGPGKAVNVPASGSGLPAGSALSQVINGESGQVRVTLDLGAALSGGTLELARLQTRVPDSAPYGAKHVLDIGDIRINGGDIAARADDGLHVAAYIGDGSGNGDYTVLDEQRLQRVLLAQDSGFGAYPRVDPVVLADVSGNGQLSSLDALRLRQQVQGINRPEIPEIPTDRAPLVFGGADPRLAIPTVDAAPGQTVVLPVSIVDSAAGVESGQLTVNNDASRLSLTEVSRGELIADTPFFVVQQQPGQVSVDFALAQPRPAAPAAW